MTLHLQQLNGTQSSKRGIWKGYLFREKWYIKGEGVGPRGGAFSYTNLLSIPPPLIFLLLEWILLKTRPVLFCSSRRWMWKEAIWKRLLFSAGSNLSLVRTSREFGFHYKRACFHQLIKGRNISWNFGVFFLVEMQKLLKWVDTIAFFSSLWKRRKKVPVFKLN